MYKVRKKNQKTINDNWIHNEDEFRKSKKKRYNIKIKTENGIVQIIKTENNCF